MAARKPRTQDAPVVEVTDSDTGTASEAVDAAAAARIAELEHELHEAEVALGTAPSAPVVPDRTGEAVWMRDPQGREWHVEHGSTPHEQLLEKGSVEFQPEHDEPALD